MRTQEKRQNANKTSEEIQNWKCNMMARNGLRILWHISMEIRSFPSLFIHGFGWQNVWLIVKFYFSIEVQLYHFQIWSSTER